MANTMIEVPKGLFDHLLYRAKRTCILERRLETIHNSTRPEIMDIILGNAREHLAWIHEQSRDVIEHE